MNQIISVHLNTIYRRIIKCSDILDVMVMSTIERESGSFVTCYTPSNPMYYSVECSTEKLPDLASVARSPEDVQYDVSSADNEECFDG